MKTLNIGLLGCGHVGSSLVELLDQQRRQIAARTGLDLRITRIAVRSMAKDRGRGVDRGILDTDSAAVAADPGIDLVVEVIGGIEPALSLLRTAIAEGKSVVTANKELLAEHGGELFAAADEAGVDLLFEAAVAGAIPLMRPLRESLVGERVRRVMGIINGTTNYILTRMAEHGAGYADALAEAQELGYAESDPTADVEGFDAGAKAAIIATIAFGASVAAGDVYHEGISEVTPHDIEMAKRLGYTVKAIAIVERVGDGDDGEDVGASERAGAGDVGASERVGAGTAAASESAGAGSAQPGTLEPEIIEPEIAVRVHPAMVPVQHPLAAVRDSFNAVFIESDAAGELMFYGRGAGGRPTAGAVLGDVVDAAVNLANGGPGRIGRLTRARIRPMDELRSAYYMDLEVTDKPGVLATVADVFGRHRVSIRSMEQHGLGDDARLVFITHECLERDLQSTLRELRALDVVHRLGTVIRVVGDEQKGA